MEELFIISYVLFFPYLTVYGDSFSTVVPLNIELNSTVKSGLRYGFQKTSECFNFEKSFLCIQKCLDLNFDVAYADKNCKCTCHVKADKAKYTLKYNFTRTKWKLGAPTTSIPPWAQHKKQTEQTQSDHIVEVNQTEETQLADSVTATAGIIGAGTSGNVKGTPASLSETGTAGSQLATGIATGSSVSAGTGTETKGAAATAANAATGTAAGPKTGVTAVAATVTGHGITNAAATEAKVATTVAP